MSKKTDHKKMYRKVVRDSVDVLNELNHAKNIIKGLIIGLVTVEELREEYYKLHPEEKENYEKEEKNANSRSK